MRDFIGYGGRPPRGRWGNGAGLAINLAINVEEGAEASPLDGDPAAESALSEVPAGRVPAGMRDLAVESIYEYGARAGFWRLHGLIRERGLPYTAFVCTQAVERNPPVAEALGDPAIDLCCHGLRWENHFPLDRETEETRIETALTRLHAAVGKSAAGWYCRYAPSPQTREIVAARSDLLYDSDSYADDLPYYAPTAAGWHLVLPYALDSNDAQFKTPSGFGTGADFFTYLQDAVTVLRREGETSPRLFSVGLHCRLAGRPGRAAALARFLDWLVTLDDVWIAGREAIARDWRTHYPPPTDPPAGPRNEDASA